MKKEIKKKEGNNVKRFEGRNIEKQINKTGIKKR